MFEEYLGAVNLLGLEEVIQDENHNDIPKELIYMRNCVEMYDQEYMVKVNMKKDNENIIINLLNLPCILLGVYKRNSLG